MSDLAWDTYLGGLESAVDVQSGLLRDGLLERLRPVQDGTPPAELGPLPPSQAARATRVLSRLEALTAELRLAHAATSRELGDQRRLRPSPGPAAAASFVDSYG